MDAAAAVTESSSAQERRPVRHTTSRGFITIDGEYGTTDNIGRRSMAVH